MWVSCYKNPCRLVHVFWVSWRKKNKTKQNPSLLPKGRELGGSKKKKDLPTFTSSGNASNLSILLQNYFHPGIRKFPTPDLFHFITPCSHVYKQIHSGTVSDTLFISLWAPLWKEQGYGATRQVPLKKGHQKRQYVLIYYPYFRVWGKIWPCTSSQLCCSQDIVLFPRVWVQTLGQP